MTDNLHIAARVWLDTQGQLRPRNSRSVFLTNEHSTQKQAIQVAKKAGHPAIKEIKTSPGRLLEPL